MFRNNNATLTLLKHRVLKNIIENINIDCSGRLCIYGLQVLAVVGGLFIYCDECLYDYDYLMPGVDGLNVTYLLNDVRLLVTAKYSKE